MKLRGIDFGHVLDASGVRAWFGEGHSYHHLVPANLSFLGSTFVAKTTTLNARAGNARMSTDGLKTKLWQDCVKVYWRTLGAGSMAASNETVLPIVHGDRTIAG
jgi:hypothetical protein